MLNSALPTKFITKNITTCRATLTASSSHLNKTWLEFVNNLSLFICFPCSLLCFKSCVLLTWIKWHIRHCRFSAALLAQWVIHIRQMCPFLWCTSIRKLHRDAVNAVRSRQIFNLPVKVSSSLGLWWGTIVCVWVCLRDRVANRGALHW